MRRLSGTGITSRMPQLYWWLFFVLIATPLVLEEFRVEPAPSPYVVTILVILLIWVALILAGGIYFSDQKVMIIRWFGVRSAPRSSLTEVHAEYDSTTSRGWTTSADDIVLGRGDPYGRGDLRLTVRTRSTHRILQRLRQECGFANESTDVQIRPVPAGLFLGITHVVGSHLEFVDHDGPQLKFWFRTVPERSSDSPGLGTIRHTEIAAAITDAPLVPAAKVPGLLPALLELDPWAWDAPTISGWIGGTRLPIYRGDLLPLPTIGPRLIEHREMALRVLRELGWDPFTRREKLSPPAMLRLEPSLEWVTAQLRSLGLTLAVYTTADTRVLPPAHHGPGADALIAEIVPPGKPLTAGYRQGSLPRRSGTRRGLMWLLYVAMANPRVRVAIIHLGHTGAAPERYLSTDPLAPDPGLYQPRTYAAGDVTLNTVQSRIGAISPWYPEPDHPSTPSPEK